jgi:ubiquinone/menaquinone biosynthesis C-methylase UbiE
MSTTTTVQHQYDRWAAVYDCFWRRYNQRTAAALQRAARLRADEEVLNVGCGTGVFERRILKKHPAQPMTGTDLSEKMLAAARRKTHFGSRACFLQADAHALPFEEASFDVVVSASAPHYFANPLAALGEMARVVRPGGRVVLLDWCRDFCTTRLLDAFLRRFDPAYRACYSQAELHGYVRTAGFAVRRSRRFRVGLVWGMMVVEAARVDLGEGPCARSARALPE